MLGAVAASKKPKKPTPRKLSKLSAVGDEASKSARRALLLATLDALKWDMTRVASALELATNADVIRALKELAPDEYAEAQNDGRIQRGRRANEG